MRSFKSFELAVFLFGSTRTFRWIIKVAKDQIQVDLKTITVPISSKLSETDDHSTKTVRVKVILSAIYGRGQYLFAPAI